MITNKQLSKKLIEFEKIIQKKYARKSKRESKKKRRNWKTYEEEYMSHVKTAMRELEPLLKEASSIRRFSKRGKKFQLTVKQKITILLIKHLMRKNNRPMAGMLCLFSLLSGVNIGYKTIERLYSDDEVEMALHNLFLFQDVLLCIYQANTNQFLLVCLLFPCF